MSLKAFVQDLIDNGTGYNSNPCYDWSSKESMHKFWSNRFEELEKTIRERAQRALNEENGIFEWTAWNGPTKEKPRPFKRNFDLTDIMLVLKFRNGETHTTQCPLGWDWEQKACSDDIVAYRFIA